MIGQLHLKGRNRFSRGFKLLAVVVALCMFFSGTIRTIATAKVRITRAQQGKRQRCADPWPTDHLSF